MRSKQYDSDEEQDRQFLNHLRDLGLPSTQDYLAWCGEHGFARRVKKHWKQRTREVYFAKEAIAKARLQSKKRESRDPLGTIAEICKGRLHAGEVTQPHLARFCQAIQLHTGPKRERARHLESLQLLVTRLHRCRAKLFDGSPACPESGGLVGNTYLEALVLVATHWRHWYRPVEAWAPTTKNARRQFASLLRHLFAKYDDVPRFFDIVWFAGRDADSEVQRTWYLHVARGESIRTCNLPIPYTRKMAHFFRQAPDDLSVLQALRWGQILAWGGDDRLARALFGTRLGESFKHEDFWSTVVKWLIDHPLLDRAHVGPIVDYLHHQRFVAEHVFVAPGVREASTPAQPNLSMRGRTSEALLRQVHRWHGRLASNNSHQVREWASCGIQPFEFEEGNRQGGNVKIWTIRELTGSKALVAEGRQLKHCVASYASSCARGDCSIWTMEVESFEGALKALTVEVRNNTRTICQARGKLNRLPTEKEKNVLVRWAAAAGLKVASHV